MNEVEISDFDQIRLLNQNNIFDYIPMGHPHRPSTPAILFVKHGTISLKEHITTYHLTQNNILFIDSNSVYEVIDVEDNPAIILLCFKRHFLENISIKLNKVQVYQSLKPQLKRTFILPQDEMQIMIDNLLKLDYYQNKKHILTYTNEIIEHYFISILFHVASVVESSIDAHYNVLTRNQRIVNDFIFLVSENYLNHKNVMHYAQKLGITSRYLSAVIKKETGKTSQDFITEFLINEAKAQLSSTTNDIKQIALKLNFSDQYSFSHFFKKNTGTSPSLYRKQFLK